MGRCWGPLCSGPFQKIRHPHFTLALNPPESKWLTGRHGVQGKARPPPMVPFLSHEAERSNPVWKNRKSSFRGNQTGPSLMLPDIVCALSPYSSPFTALNLLLLKLIASSFSSPSSLFSSFYLLQPPHSDHSMGEQVRTWGEPGTGTLGHSSGSS